MRVEESIEINRPLQEVFDYISDVGNYPEWMAHALEVRKDTEGSPQQNDRFIVAIKSVGRRFETRVACSSCWNRFRSGQPSANLEKTCRR
jgi:ribosome-associated toxin RatA of RatAB toxin-antitoxin module